MSFLKPVKHESEESSLQRCPHETSRTASRGHGSR